MQLLNRESCFLHPKSYDSSRLLRPACRSCFSRLRRNKRNHPSNSFGCVHRGRAGCGSVLVPLRCQLAAHICACAACGSARLCSGVRACACSWKPSCVVLAKRAQARATRVDRPRAWRSIRVRKGLAHLFGDLPGIDRLSPETRSRRASDFRPSPPRRDASDRISDFARVEGTVFQRL